MRKTLFSLLLLLASYTGIQAATTLSDTTKVSRPISGERLHPTLLSDENSTQLINLGGLMLKDEYLSPLEYRGKAFSYHFDRIKQIKQTPWIFNNQIDLQLGTTVNPAQNASMYLLRGELRAASLYGLVRLPKRINYYIGAGAFVSLGGIYNSRNGNNPATLKLPAMLHFSNLVVAHLPLKKFPARLRLSFDLGLLGTAFSQHFGESYYEQFYLETNIRNGLKDGMRFAHIVNYQDVRLQVLADLPIKHFATITLGYKYECTRSYLDFLHTSIRTHYISIGFSKTIRSFGGRRNTTQF